MRVEFLEPNGGYTSEIVCNALSLVLEDPPEISEVEKWTRLEKVIAYDWAFRVHLRASDNYVVRARERPSFVKSKTKGGLDIDNMRE